MAVYLRRSRLLAIGAVSLIEALSIGSTAHASSREMLLTQEMAPSRELTPAPSAPASTPTTERIPSSRIAVEAKPKLDLSGKRRVGKASFYARMFSGRKMADGNPMDPQKNNAASRTLPLGTIAKVTNLKTGKSAVVTIQDRGPYVVGRIVDLSPATAHEIGITPREGVTKVEVAPLAVPQPDGRVKFGEAADEATLAALQPELSLRFRL
jgi:rare lipoprotein A